MFDQVKNFVRVNVEGTHSETDTEISIDGDDINDLPDTSNGEYNLVWWDTTEFPAPEDDPDVEIVRVTEVDYDNNVITVNRGREDTSASSKDTVDRVYQMILAPTAKKFNDYEDNFVPKSDDVTNFSGESGLEGQFLQTDGTSLSFADVIEEVKDFDSIPANPRTGKAFTTTDKGELFVEVNN